MDHYLETYADAARDVRFWRLTYGDDKAKAMTSACIVESARRPLVLSDGKPYLSPLCEAWLDAFGGRLY